MALSPSETSSMPEPRNDVQARAVAQGIRLDALPQHIACIMDGNGRWATARGEHRLVGHQQGYLTLKDVLTTADELGVRYLTVYGFSAENWRRPGEEVNGLMDLIAAAASAELTGLIKNNVRVRISGRLDELPQSTRDNLRALEAETKDNTGITFVLAVNYGGRQEILDAARAVAEAGEPWTEESISKHLYTPEIPEPDLMVRTAGELRWSNFLIWQAAYAELYVTDSPWPEFGEEELFAAVTQFQRRIRKFGGLAEG